MRYECPGAKAKQITINHLCKRIIQLEEKLQKANEEEVALRAIVHEGLDSDSDGKEDQVKQTK